MRALVSKRANNAAQRAEVEQSGSGPRQEHRAHHNTATQASANEKESRSYWQLVMRERTHCARGRRPRTRGPRGFGKRRCSCASASSFCKISLVACVKCNERDRRGLEEVN